MANTRIIIYFFIIINTFIKCSVWSSCENNVPNDKYDCIDRISEDDKDDGYHCCLRVDTYTGEARTTKTCEILEKDEFNDIDGYIDDLLRKNTDGTLDDIDVQCYQSYLKLNIYMLFAFLNLLVLIIN